jgi:hypothetical protein
VALPRSLEAFHFHTYIPRRTCITNGVLFYSAREDTFTLPQATELCVLCTEYHHIVDTSLYCLNCLYVTVLNVEAFVQLNRCSPNTVSVPIHHGASTRSAQAAQGHAITRLQPPSQLAPRHMVHFHASPTAPRVTHSFDTYRAMHVLGSSRLFATAL